MIKKIFSCLVIVVIFIASISFAEELIANNEEIDVGINHYVKIIYKDKYLKFYDAQKREVYPLSYNGSTYLPIRAISGLFNTSILWSGVENKIYLNSPVGLVDNEAISFADEDCSVNEIVFEKGILNRRIVIEKDGIALSFYDEQKNDVFPISYNDTTYLPVRALSNIFDRSIYYEAKTNSVLLFDNIDELNYYLDIKNDAKYLKYKGIDDSFFNDVEVSNPKKDYPNYIDEKYSFNKNNGSMIVLNQIDDSVIYIDVSRTKNDLIYSYNTRTKKTVLLTKIDKSWYSGISNNDVVRLDAFGFSDFGVVQQYKAFDYKYIFVSYGSKIYIGIDGDIKYLYMIDVPNKASREIYRSTNLFDLLIKDDYFYIIDEKLIGVNINTAELSEVTETVFNNLFKFSTYFSDNLEISGIYYCDSFLGEAELIFPEPEIGKLIKNVNFDYLKKDASTYYYPAINEKFFKKVENDSAYVFRITLSRYDYIDSQDAEETLIVSSYYYYDRATKNVYLLNFIDHRNASMLSDYGTRYYENEFVKEIGNLYSPDFFTKNEYNTLKADFVNVLGDVKGSKFYDYIYNVPLGDDTEIKYVSGDYVRNEPITSGEVNFELAVLNDSLSQFFLQYEEDPITGKNIYEETIDTYEKELELCDSDILKALKVQKTNLEEAFPEYYGSKEDYYFALNGLLICNGNLAGDYKNYARAKDILVIINDDIEIKYTLNDSDEFHFIDLRYIQKDIEKPIKVKIKVLSTYKGFRSQDIYFSHIIPSISSNIPQGR